ncbi:MAG: DUF3963 domain-containing protein [Campylobacter sp.]
MRIFIDIYLSKLQKWIRVLKVCFDLLAQYLFKQLFVV